MKLRHAVAVLLVLALCCGLADGFFGSKDGKKKDDEDEVKGGQFSGLAEKAKNKVVELCKKHCEKALKYAGGKILEWIKGKWQEVTGGGGEDGENDKKEEEDMKTGKDEKDENDDKESKPDKRLDTSDDVSGWQDGGKETVEEKGLSAAAIAGIVVGCCVLTMGMTIGIVLLVKSKNKPEEPVKGDKEGAGSKSSRSSKGSRSSKSSRSSKGSTSSKGSKKGSRKGSRKGSSRSSRGGTNKSSRRSSMSASEAGQSNVDISIRGSKVSGKSTRNSKLKA